MHSDTGSRAADVATKVAPRTAVKILTALLFVCASQTAIQANAAQDDQTIDQVGRHTPANTEILIRAHAQWTQQCSVEEPPEIDITIPPEHGHINLRLGTAPLGSNAVGGTSCLGRTGTAMMVLYQPETDYRGHDTLTYQVHYRGNVIRTIQARIRVD